MTLDQVKHDVALGSRIMANIGLAEGINSSMGHVSLRDPSDPNRFVVKGRGYDIDVLSRMRPEDMVVCDLNGYLIDGPPGVLQCNEVMIHACVLRARPEINSVVHAHPPFCVMLTVLGIPIVPMGIAGIRMIRKPLPVYPRPALITSEAYGQEMTTCLGSFSAVQLYGHGVTTVGKTMEEAIKNAKSNWPRIKARPLAKNFSVWASDAPEINVSDFDGSVSVPAPYALEKIQTSALAVTS